MHPFPQAPQGHAGISKLYMPHRLFAGRPDSFQPTDSPFIPGQTPLLPIPLPAPLGPSVPNGDLRMHPLRKALYATSQKSRTKPSVRIDRLKETGDGLNHVFVCTSFWDNLIRYARSSNQPHGSHDSTWTLAANRRIPLPLAEQQVDGIKVLAGWYLHHINRVSTIPLMNREDSVHGEFLVQGIEPMNGFLKTRYPPLGDHNDDVQYPRWSRACNALHKDAASGHQSNAGYSDFMLIRSSSLHDNGAVAELKPLWACTRKNLEEIFMEEYAVNPDGTFAHDLTSLQAKLLKQIWGELYYFECHLGVFTNGEQVFFFAKSGRNTLILSSLKRWDDPDMHTALAGISFAGVDIRHVRQAHMIDQILCPQADRAPHWV